MNGLDINEIVMSSSESEHEDDVMTGAEVLQTLQEAWINERKSPTLMDSRVDIVDCVIANMKEMQANINRQNQRSTKTSIHQLEVDRIKFMLSSYLRCRIKKIDKYCGYFLNEHNSDPTKSRLSPDELTYAQETRKSLMDHFEQSALKHMPTVLRNTNLENCVPRPNLEKYVFIEVKEEESNVVVDPETEDQVADVVDFNVGEKYLIRYKLVERLIDEGQLCLV